MGYTITDYVKAIMAKLESDAQEYEYDAHTGHLWRPKLYEKKYHAALPGPGNFTVVAICIVCGGNGVWCNESILNEYTYKKLRAKFPDMDCSCKEIRLRSLLK